MNVTDTDNLMKLLSEEKEIVDKPDAEELVDAKGEIELDHVSSLCHWIDIRLHFLTGQLLLRRPRDRTEGHQRKDPSWYISSACWVS